MAVNISDEKILRAYVDELSGPRDEDAQTSDYDTQAVARLRDKLRR